MCTSCSCQWVVGCSAPEGDPSPLQCWLPSCSPPLQVIGEDSAALGGYVTSEEFIRLSDTSTCGKMEASCAALRYAALCCALLECAQLLPDSWIRVMLHITVSTRLARLP